jgi:activator of HSP90 ATPase
MSSIHQEVVLPAPPRRIYAALTESADFAKMTGAPAQIEAREGGSFSCFGGMILGRSVELVPGQRVVQAWRVGNWPAGLYSIARFELQPEGAGTRLLFDHTGFPASDAAHLEAGWETNYWKPLRSLPG